MPKFCLKIICAHQPLDNPVSLSCNLSCSSSKSWGLHFPWMAGVGEESCWDPDRCRWVPGREDGQTHTWSHSPLRNPSTLNKMPRNLSLKYIVANLHYICHQTKMHCVTFCCHNQHMILIFITFIMYILLLLNNKCGVFSHFMFALLPNPSIKKKSLHTTGIIVHLKL